MGEDMMYLVLDVQSTEHTENCCQVNAWVNARNQSEAMNILGEELSLEGWAVLAIVDASSTDESDYFPPCKALDAYKEAQKKLFSLRFW